MEKEITKEYTNGELTIVWKPKMCIHSGVCVKMLPEVYKPREKPWITIENASTSDLKTQIKECPSGALSYYINNTEDKIEEKEKESSHTEITIINNGPLRILGDVKIQSATGDLVDKKGPTSFCRCGASENKPFCDGTHRKIEFKG